MTLLSSVQCIPSNRIHPMVLIQITVILLLVVHPKAADAAIYACQSGDTTIFQDRPCPIAATRPSTSKSASHFPMSIHESWFVVPEQARERAFCDRQGCECGLTERKHQGSLVQSVIDALYLDGSWHRYETSYQLWYTSPPGSKANLKHRDMMLEAACDVMMSQVLLRNFADDVIALLKKRVQTAEERGFDVQQPCLSGVPDACAFYDSVLQLERMKYDASALLRERKPSDDPLADYVTSIEDSDLK